MSELAEKLVAYAQSMPANSWESYPLTDLDLAQGHALSRELQDTCSDAHFKLISESPVVFEIRKPQ